VCVDARLGNHPASTRRTEQHSASVDDVRERLSLVMRGCGAACPDHVASLTDVFSLLECAVTELARVVGLYLEHVPTHFLCIPIFQAVHDYVIRSALMDAGLM
jgi:hypothetical protein